MEKLKVVKNATWIIAARIVQALLAMVLTIITARYLGPSNFGTINYAASIVAFVLPVMQLGLTAVLVQEFVNNPEKEGEILGSSVAASFISALISVVGIFSFVMIANHDETETVIVCMLYSILVPISVFDVFRYWFQAKLLSKYTAAVSLFAYIIVSAYKIFLLVTGKSIRWFAVSNALDTLIIVSAIYVIYRRLGGKRLSFNRELLKGLLQKSKYYIVSGLMITVFAQTDRIMLKLMIDDASTGYYSAAVACAGMTSFIFAAIIDSARPAIFESKKISASAFENNMCRLYSVVIYFALLQSLLIALFSGLIVKILYGAAYFPAVGALRIIVWYTTFSYLGAVRNIWMLAEGKQRLIWRIDLSGALINVLLNLLLIPRYDIDGAAAASLLTQIFANVVMVGVLKETRVNIGFMLKSLSLKLLSDFLKSIIKERRKSSGS